MKKILSVSVLAFCFLSFVSCGSSGSDGGESSGGFPRCGNNTIEGNEVCDGDVECWEAGHFYPEGKATCNSDCSAYDTSKCVPRDPSDKCGNGELDGGETCEQGETKLCSELKPEFTEGNATCRRDCRGWETMNCSKGGKNKPCSLILDCVKACGDASCAEECKKAGTDDGLAKYEVLEQCAAACGGVSDEDCLTKNCYDAYFACKPNDRCGNGVLDEGEICEHKETKPCQELNTDEQQWQPIGEAVCNAECKGWDTYACVDINALTCYQLFECTQDCSDSECDAACIEKTSAPAKAKYDVMKTCLDTNCPVVTEECINEFCKFQTDACKTHITCGNEMIDKPYEICEKGEHIDCGEIKDENGEAVYEAGTGNAYCNQNCTEYGVVSLCHKFCSCSEIMTCIEQECGGYPKSNAENTEEKIACMENCESYGSKAGEAEASMYRQLVEGCCKTDASGNCTNVTGWDYDQCTDKSTISSQTDWSCGSEDNPKCPY